MATFVAPSLKKYQDIFNAEKARVDDPSIGRVFGPGMAGYEGMKKNIDYYSPGGKGYESELADFNRQQAIPKAKALGITVDQLLANPELETDPAALTKYKTADTKVVEGKTLGALGSPETPAPTFGPSAYSGFSLVDYLGSFGQPTDLASRAKLAVQFGIAQTPEEYLNAANAGTNASMNTSLLQKLRSGQVPVPLGSSTPAGSPPGSNPPGGPSSPGDTTLGSVSGNDDKSKVDAAAAAAQKTAEEVFASMGKETSVDTRDSAKILAAIETAAGAPPEKPKSLVELFNEKKKDLGIEPLETELATIDSDIEAINANLLIEAEKAGEKLISTREISREKGQLQTRAEREIALKNIERSSVARQLTQKYDTLQTIMTLTGNDFTNASNYYTQNFNRAVSLYGLVNQQEQQALTAADRAKNDARANITVLQNLLKDGNLDYASFSADQKTKIQQLEVQAGYPAGFLQMVDGEDKKIQSTTSYTGVDGKQYFDVLYVDGNGHLSTQTISSGGVKAVSDNQTEGETTRTAVSEMSTQLNMVKGPDGHVSPSDYKKALDAWGTKGFSEEDFLKSFKRYVNPSHYKDYGISATDWIK